MFLQATIYLFIRTAFTHGNVVKLCGTNDVHVNANAL